MQVAPLVRTTVGDGDDVVWFCGWFTTDNTVRMRFEILRPDAPPLAIIPARGRAWSSVWLAPLLGKMGMVGTVTAVPGPPATAANSTWLKWT